MRRALYTATTRIRWLHDSTHESVGMNHAWDIIYHLRYELDDQGQRPLVVTKTTTLSIQTYLEVFRYIHLLFSFIFDRFSQHSKLACFIRSFIT